MSYHEMNLEYHVLRVLDMSLSLVLATIVIRTSDLISYQLDKWFYPAADSEGSFEDERP